MEWAKKKHPHLIVIIENPVGSLQKMPLMDEFCEKFHLHAVEVHYCAFGRDEKKPTNLWSNDVGLTNTLGVFKCGQRTCKYYQDGHPMSVRNHGNTYDFSAIPQPLAEEVAAYVDGKFVVDRIRRQKAVSPTE